MNGEGFKATSNINSMHHSNMAAARVRKPTAEARTTGLVE